MCCNGYQQELPSHPMPQLVLGVQRITPLAWHLGGGGLPALLALALWGTCVPGCGQATSSSITSLHTHYLVGVGSLTPLASPHWRPENGPGKRLLL